MIRTEVMSPSYSFCSSSQQRERHPSLSSPSHLGERLRATAEGDKETGCVVGVDSCSRVAPVGEMDNDVEAAAASPWPPTPDVPTMLLFWRLRSLSSVSMASLI